MVVITGQVPTHLIGTDAFQECDTVGITRPCTKHNYLVKRVEDLPHVLHEAFRIATTGRPGPVVVDIPKDIQFATGLYVGPGQARASHNYHPRTQGDPAKIAEAAALIASARRPILYTGGGGDQRRTRGQPAAARVRRPHSRPGHLDPDGPGRLPGQRPGLARHGRHARRLGSQSRHARLRRDGGDRFALRRPRHRPARRLLARLEADPHRHRSVVDRQGGAHRHRHRRRRRQRAGRPDRRVEAPAPGPQRRGAEGLVGADRRLARPQGLRLPALERADQATARDRAALRPHPRAATSTSPPRSASTRCGRRSSSTSTSRTAG